MVQDGERAAKKAGTSTMTSVNHLSSTGEANAGDLNTDKNGTRQNTESSYRRTQAATSSTQQLVCTFERAFRNMATYASGYSNYQPEAAATALQKPQRTHCVQTHQSASQYGDTRQTMPKCPTTRGFRAADRRAWGPVRSVRNTEEWGDAVLIRSSEKNGSSLRATQHGGR